MNEIIEKENIKIKNIIYEMRRVQVIIDPDVVVFKYYDYIYGKIITHYILSKRYQLLLN